MKINNSIKSKSVLFVYVVYLICNTKIIQKKKKIRIYIYIINFFFFFFKFLFFYMEQITSNLFDNIGKFKI